MRHIEIHAEGSHGPRWIPRSVSTGQRCIESGDIEPASSAGVDDHREASPGRAASIPCSDPGGWAGAGGGDRPKPSQTHHGTYLWSLRSRNMRANISSVSTASWNPYRRALPVSETTSYSQPNTKSPNAHETTCSYR